MQWLILPHAGGSRSYYRGLLPKEMRSVGVTVAEYAGHGSRYSEPLIRTIEGIAQDCRERYLPKAQGAFCLFGHSFGCLVAYELARQARAFYGREADLVVLSACGPPCERPRPDQVSLHDSELVERLRRLGGTPAELLESHELLSLLLPAFRTDLEALHKYAAPAEPPFKSKVLVLGGDRDPTVSPNELGGWSRRFLQAPTIRMFRGGHFFIEEDPDFLFLLRSLLTAPADAATAVPQSS